MKLNKTEIGSKFKPYFIAEMSGNHNHSLERAFQIIDAAAEAGANALKIQTYTPETMTLDLKEKEFFIEDKNSLWKGRSLFDLYAEAMTPWEWHKPIKERCEQKGMDFFSTPFDFTAVDFLEELNVPFYKIASFENIDLPLIEKVARTKKPIIISTGMATLTEISEAVELIQKYHNNIVLLKCTSAYPAKAEDANLATIPSLRSNFNVEVGLSDHTLGNAVPIASVVLGATVIEKHFTLARSEGGVDSKFSLEPAEFKLMIEEVNNAWASVGNVFYGVSPAEKNSKIFRRSLYISEDVRAGEKLTPKNLRAIRPGLGLPPKYYEQLLGQKVTKDCKKGTPASWDLFR